MIVPYLASLEAFLLIFNALPIPFRAYVITSIFIFLGVKFILWLVGEVLS